MIQGFGESVFFHMDLFLEVNFTISLTYRKYKNLRIRNIIYWRIALAKNLNYLNHDGLLAASSYYIGVGSFLISIVHLLSLRNKTINQIIYAFDEITAPLHNVLT